MAHWASGVGRKPCDECRAAYQPSPWDTKEDKKRKAGGSPCETCKTDLLPGNAEAWMIYQRCSGQLIMSMEGGVDINVLAVKVVMDLEEVADQRGCLEKVQKIAWKALAEQAKEREKLRDGKGR